MGENKKESILYNIVQAMRQIYEGNPPVVWYVFCKNILEGAFDAICGVYFIKFIYECIEDQVDFHKLFVMVSVVCLFHIIVHLISAYNIYLENIATMKIYQHIFQQIIHRAKKIEISQYENSKFYDNFSRALDEALEQGMKGLYLTAWGVGCVVRATVAMIILVSVNVVLLAFVIPPLLGSLYFGLKEGTEEFAARRAETVGKRKMEYAKRVFYEKKYAGELRLYPMAKVLFGIHKEGYQERYQKNKIYQRRIAVYRIIETLLFAGIISFGSYLYITYRLKIGGNNSVASYVAMVSAVGYIVTCINDALGHFSEAGKFCMYMKSIRDFLKCPVEGSVQNVVLPEKNMGEISFENVSYHYAGSSQMIIKNLNLKVRQGEHIALVGENGAGKTTLMKLLMGLYSVSDGNITVGGEEISKYEPEAYRDCFGTVFQDFQIFSLPLCENVLMKAPETDEERKIVVDALEKAQFGEVLKKLPKGIDTFLTKEFDENGFVCSGGQAQKVAIARVFAKKEQMQIAILDEPSSALDPWAEYELNKNIMNRVGNATVIFISHRLSTTRDADCIYMFENGEIIEQGTHQELMTLGGQYADMFQCQAKYYQENAEVFSVACQS